MPKINWDRTAPAPQALVILPRPASHRDLQGVTLVLEDASGDLYGVCDLKGADPCAFMISLDAWIKQAREGGLKICATPPAKKRLRVAMAAIRERENALSLARMNVRFHTKTKEG